MWFCTQLAPFPFSSLTQRTVTRTVNPNPEPADRGQPATPPRTGKRGPGVSPGACSHAPSHWLVLTRLRQQSFSHWFLTRQPVSVPGCRRGGSVAYEEVHGRRLPLLLHMCMVWTTSTINNSILQLYLPLAQKIRNRPPPVQFLDGLNCFLEKTRSPA